MMRVLSLGAGVQSSTILLMSCRGELPRIDHAIFSDVGWEPAAVYEHLKWLKKESESYGIPVHIVGQGRSIREDALNSQVRGVKSDGKRWASMPYYTKKIWQPSDANEFEKLYLSGIETEIDGMEFELLHEDSNAIDENISKRIQELRSLRLGIPVVHMGMIRRQCTSEYKIAHIELFIKRNLWGLQPNQRVPKDYIVEQWIGISTDESSRMKPNKRKWARNSWPLIDILGYDRDDCLSWLKRTYPERNVPRSSCIGCPFHSDIEWRWLRDNSPDEFADACDFDNAIRNCGGMRGQVFIHRDCIPLQDVDLDSKEEKGQQNLFINECEGMCGV